MRKMFKLMVFSSFLKTLGVADNSYRNGRKKNGSEKGFFLLDSHRSETGKIWREMNTKWSKMNRNKEGETKKVKQMMRKNSLEANQKMWSKIKLFFYILTKK
jgi:hypothetical protein